MEVSLNRNIEIDQRVVGERGEQVVEETDSCIDSGFTGSIEVEGDLDAGFAGRSFDGGRTGHCSLLERADMSFMFSVGERTVNLK